MTYEQIYQQELRKAVLPFLLEIEQMADGLTADLIFLDPSWEKYTKKYRKEWKGLRKEANDIQT